MPALEITSVAPTSTSATLTDIDSLASINVVFSGPTNSVVHWARRTVQMCEGDVFRLTGDFGLIEQFGDITGTPTLTFDRDIDLTATFKAVRKDDRPEFEISGGIAGESTTFTITVSDDLGRTICGKGTIHVIDQSFGIVQLRAEMVATPETEATLS